MISAIFQSPTSLDGAPVVSVASALAAADSAGFWLEQPVMLAAARAAQLNSANNLFFIKILLKIFLYVTPVYHGS